MKIKLKKYFPDLQPYKSKENPLDRMFFRIYFTTLYVTVDHEVDVITLTEEAEPENSVSKAEGYNNIAGWLCFTAPKLSKLGKRKSEPDQTLESEFVVSEWIDLQSAGNQNKG